MDLNKRFYELIDYIKKLKITDQTKKSVHFLNSINMIDLTQYFKQKVNGDLTRLSKIVVTNPPTMFELFNSWGYSLEILYWYPLPEYIDMGGYDTEDIHDHFGFIATRMLKGEGYIEKKYLVNKENEEIELEKELHLKKDKTNLISPDYIHSISYLSKEPSISIRIVFPPSRGIMTVYDRDTKKKKQEIVCATETKAYELGGMLSFIDKNLFKETVDKLHNHLILEQSKNQLSKLVEINGN